MFQRRNPLLMVPGGKDEDAGPVNWWRLVRYLRPYKLRMGIGLFTVLLSAALSLVFPAVIRSVIDSVLINGDEELLTRITIGLIVVFFLRSITIR